MYVEPDYANSRLNRTVVRLGNIPVYVVNVRGDKQCEVLHDINKEEEVALVHLDDLNPLSPALGYTNYNGKALYLSRKPLRRDYRQGLRTSQVEVMVGNRGDNSIKLIMRCITGDFPTIQRANEKLIDGARSVAISRDVCLTRNGIKINVMYKWHVVGLYKDGAIVLNEKYSFLRKLVEKI
tara:strand:+ start:30525 stop:31067 length:543 start_codon:yes stop_codon:yes gene_type:complete